MYDLMEQLSTQEYVPHAFRHFMKYSTLKISWLLWIFLRFYQKFTQRQTSTQYAYTAQQKHLCVNDMFLITESFQVTVTSTHEAKICLFFLFLNERLSY